MTAGAEVISVPFRWNHNPPGTAHYTIHWGEAPGVYMHKLVAPLKPPPLDEFYTFSVDLSPTRTYYFAVTASDASGLESDYSVEVVVTEEMIRSFGRPPPPTGLRVGKLIIESSYNLRDWEPVATIHDHPMAEMKQFFRVIFTPAT